MLENPFNFRQGNAIALAIRLRMQSFKCSKEFADLRYELYRDAIGAGYKNH